MNATIAAIQTMFSTLLERWEDEQGYESFGDYIAAMRGVVNSQGARFVEMKPEPFSLVFVVNNVEYSLVADDETIILHEAKPASSPTSEFAKGTPVISRDGERRGELTGANYHCQLHGCTGLRLVTRWPDSKTTRPCSRGMQFTDGAWHIL